MWYKSKLKAIDAVKYPEFCKLIRDKKIKFISAVENLGNIDRGGFGSTGRE